MQEAGRLLPNGRLGRGAPKFWVQATNESFLQRARVGAWSFHSHPVCPVTSIFSRNRSKTHSHNKLNRKELPLWSCFAFITRNIDQNTATKSLPLTKRPKKIALECIASSVLNEWRSCMPTDCVSVDTLLIHNKYFWNWSDECCWRYIYNWININVSKFLGFFVRYFWADIYDFKKSLSSLPEMHFFRHFGDFQAGCWPN